jgi:hypothetical protein
MIIYCLRKHSSGRRFTVDSREWMVDGSLGPVQTVDSLLCDCRQSTMDGRRSAWAGANGRQFTVRVSTVDNGRSTVRLCRWRYLCPAGPDCSGQMGNVMHRKNLADFSHAKTH